MLASRIASRSHLLSKSGVQLFKSCQKAPRRHFAVMASGTAQDWVKEDERRMLHAVYR
jgi:hypothetical protein